MEQWLSNMISIFWTVVFHMIITTLFCEIVPRPHLSFEAQLVAGRSHEFEPINCPDIPRPPSILSPISYGKQRHEAELKYPQRIRRLNTFPPSKNEVLTFVELQFFSSLLVFILEESILLKLKVRRYMFCILVFIGLIFICYFRGRTLISGIIYCVFTYNFNYLHYL